MSELPAALVKGPTPLRRHCPFIEHEGTEEDFANQTRDRPRGQFPPVDANDLDFGAPIEGESDESTL